MKSFANRIAATLRLVVLQVLASAAKEGVPDVNDSILRTAACEFGPVPDVQAFRTTLAWLAEHELITVREVGEFRVAALTDLGADVAAGRATVDGVRRPNLQFDA